ncbi:hypothetical protein, partial [Nonomuraea diastatica]
SSTPQPTVAPTVKPPSAGRSGGPSGVPSAGGPFDGGFIGSSIGLYGTAARGPWVVSGRAAMRWDGSGWLAYRLPSRAGAVGGEGADVWTVSGPPVPGEPAAARWNGSAWQAVGVPELGVARGAASPRARLADVAVLGPDDVWAVGGVSWLVRGKYDAEGEPLERSRPVALHWDGGAWHCRWGPLGTTFTQAEPDGAGGMWVLDATGARLLRHAGGHWTSAEIDGVVAALAWRPGTREVYAAGSVAGEGDLTGAALWRHG